MKSIIEGLDKAFDNRIRIGIMAILVVNDWVDFNTLKSLLQATDGNLATHLFALEQIEYIFVKKEFVGRKTKTSYQITTKGKDAFTMHLNTLEDLFKNVKTN
ncbi:MAG: transcriptional regulator [Cytophagia bacterium]|nr:MAG: transcriptional regulator [Cytophagia bacterium]TAG41909.1 MAG: transcriptional regulator [Cytophagia bacterium]TAH28653.1 MAG: transcriptional regulator [Cytophagales bacterium]